LFINVALLLVVNEYLKDLDTLSTYVHYLWYYNTITQIYTLLLA